MARKSRRQEADPDGGAVGCCGRAAVGCCGRAAIGCGGAAIVGCGGAATGCGGATIGCGGVGCGCAAIGGGVGCGCAAIGGGGAVAASAYAAISACCCRKPFSAALEKTAVGGSAAILAVSSARARASAVAIAAQSGTRPLSADAIACRLLAVSSRSIALFSGVYKNHSPTQRGGLGSLVRHIRFSVIFSLNVIRRDNRAAPTSGDETQRDSQDTYQRLSSPIGHVLFFAFTTRASRRWPTRISSWAAAP